MQYTLLYNVSSRTLNLLRKFRRAAELKVLVLVLWHAAPKEAIELGSLATRSGTRGTQLHHPIFFN